MHSQAGIRPLVVGREQDYIDWLGDGPGPGGLISRLYAANGVLTKTSLLAEGMVVNRYTLDDGYDLNAVFDRDDIRANMRRDMEGMIRFAEPGEDDSVFSGIHRQVYAWDTGNDAEDVTRFAARFVASSGALDGDDLAPLSEVLDRGDRGVERVNVLTSGPNVVIYVETNGSRGAGEVIAGILAPVEDRLGPAEGETDGSPTIFTEAFRWVASAEERALAG